MSTRRVANGGDVESCDDHGLGQVVEPAAKPARTKPKCHPANRRFHERLTELRVAAQAAGRERQSKSYARAVRALEKYPLPLRSAHDAASLDGIGKNIASVLEEVLEAAEDENPDTYAERCWVAIARSRLQGALKRAGVKPDERMSVQLQSEGARIEFTQRPLEQCDGAGPRPARWRAGSLRPHASSLAGRDQAARASEDSAARRESAIAQPSLGRNRRPPTASQTSLAAKCRRSVAPGCLPLPGSAAWSALMALNQCAKSTAGSSLSLAQIEQYRDSLKPQFPRCVSVLPSTLLRLCGRGLVQKVGTGQYALTGTGQSTAGTLMRKLKHRLPPWPPVGDGHKPNEVQATQIVNQVAEAGDRESSQIVCSMISEDDRPLDQLAAVLGNGPSLAREDSSHAAEQMSVNLSMAPSPSHGDPDLMAETFPPAPLVCQRSAEAPGLSQFEFQAASPEPVAKKRKPAQRQRILRAANSAPPDMSPSSPKRQRLLAAQVSAPSPPTFGGTRQVSVEQAPVCSTDEPRLVLLLDHREVGAGREHIARGAMLADLADKLGPDAAEGRALPLGDVLWVWREPKVNEQGDVSVVESIAGWIVERKTAQDLSSSIIDGRYDEQKSRLLQAPGLDGTIYMIECAGTLFGVSDNDEDSRRAADALAHRGFGQRLLHRTLPPATLSSTAVHTQFITGFHVMHTTSTPHTISSLVALHKALEARGPPVAQKVSGNCSMENISYQEFAERTKKSCHPHVFETFGRMLRVVPHCGPEATEALVDEFSTPAAFAAALRDSADTDLLLRLKARRGGRAPVTAAALAACRELFGV